MTLPFDPRKPAIKDLARIIDTTKARWQCWYAPAAVLGKGGRPSLGTLSYLPPEIRDIIYSAVLESMFDDYKWTCNPEVMYLPRYYPGMDFGERWVNLGNASFRLIVELEHLLLSKATLAFTCLAGFAHFFSTRPPRQEERHGRVQRISVRMLTYCKHCDVEEDCETWSKAIEAMPTSLDALQSITLYVGEIKYPTRAGEEMTEPELEEEVVETLKALSKQMKRKVPHAEVAVLGLQSATLKLQRLRWGYEPDYRASWRNHSQAKIMGLKRPSV